MDMKNTFRRDFMIGLTTLIGVAGLCATLFIIGQLQRWIEPSYYLRVRMDSGNGIKNTSPVTLNGVKVGQVDEMTNITDGKWHGVELRIRIDSKSTDIPRNVEAFIEKAFVGEAAFDLVIPHAGASTELVSKEKNKEDVLTLKPDTFVNQIASAVTGPLEKIVKTSESIDTFAKTYTEVGQRVNALLAPRTVTEVQGGAQANIVSTVERVDRVLAGAEKIMGDEQLLASIKLTASEAATAARDARAAIETWKRAGETVQAEASKVGGKMNTTADEAIAALQKIQTAADGLSQVMVGVNAGEGTMGQLAKNPDLYNSFRDAAVRLEKALAEVQSLAEKIKTEGVNLGL